VTANHTRHAWYAHPDVRSFFPSIDHARLLEILWRRCSSPTINWLCERIIRRDIRSDAILRGPAEVFEKVPPGKSLLRGPEGRGLPIGNHTSQFFANVYLNEIDQFAKHEFRVRYYLRYVDDLLLLSKDRDDLLAWKAAIDAFLRRNLHLELNAERSRIAPLSSGIDFLGYVVHPYHRLVRRRVVGNLRSRLPALEKRLTKEERGISWVLYRQGESEYLRDMAASYRPHLLRADTRRLRANIRRRFPWLRTALPEPRKKPFWFAPRAFPCLGAQVHWFEERYPEALVAFQVGRFWELYGSRAASFAEAARLKLYRGRRAGHRGENEAGRLPGAQGGGRPRFGTPARVEAAGRSGRPGAIDSLQVDQYSRLPLRPGIGTGYLPLASALSGASPSGVSLSTPGANSWS